MTSDPGLFSGIHRRFAHLGKSPATWTCVGLVTAIHGCITIMGGPDDPVVTKIYQYVGLSYRGISEWRFYQPLTYGLLHGDWMHLLLNSLMILGIGSRIEFILGARVFFKVIAAGVFCGGILHLALSGSNQQPILIGLSGGGIALLLLLTTLSPQSRMMPLPLSGKSLGRGILLSSLVLSLSNPALKLDGFSKLGRWLVETGLESVYEVSHGCHLGGAISGIVFGRWVLRQPITLKRLRHERARQEAKEIARSMNREKDQ